MYGKVLGIPRTEKTPFYLRSPYAASKVTAYRTTVNCRESFGMRASNDIQFTRLIEEARPGRIRCWPSSARATRKRNSARSIFSTLFRSAGGQKLLGRPKRMCWEEIKRSCRISASCAGTKALHVLNARGPAATAAVTIAEELASQLFGQS